MNKEQKLKDYTEMKDKQKQIKVKIDKIVKQITELESDKVSMMMLYRELGMKVARQTLEDALIPQLQSMLEHMKMVEN